MTPKKKVVLFIVEGFNDQTALATSLEKLLANEIVRIEAIEGDITADYMLSCYLFSLGLMIEYV